MDRLRSIIFNEVRSSQKEKSMKHILHHMQNLVNNISVYVNKCMYVWVQNKILKWKQGRLSIKGQRRIVYKL